jgi:hypothetical protein
LQGEGFSVLDVILAVKRAAKTDFPVRLCERRPGDPASLVAGAERIHRVPGWEPKLNDLDTIVGHSLSSEKRLREDRRRGLLAPPFLPLQRLKPAAQSASTSNPSLLEGCLCSRQDAR